MTRAVYIGLFALGIAVNLGVALIESGPGTMDGDYYYATGFRIAKYSEWNEPFLWNFLNDLNGLPQPIFTYWMPLPALLAAFGMRITGWMNYSGARLGFLLLGGVIPPLTARLAYTLTPHRWAGILSGLLAAFPMFYLPYLSTTESFGVSMVLSGLLLIIFPNLWHKEESADKQWKRIGLSLLVGIICGLLHMTRADGIFWLGIAFWAIAARFRIVHRLPLLVSCLVGYLLATGPWFARNLAAFGALFPPGSSRALWITQYDELFTYPASDLSLTNFLASGPIGIVLRWLWAFSQNMQTLIAVQGFVILIPLVILGAIAKRYDIRVRLGIAAWGFILFVMTVVFPFAGVRGGFFHSGAALQPLILALVPVGLEEILRWGSLKRGWIVERVRVVLGSMLVLLAILVTAYIAWQWVIGGNLHRPAWNETYRIYSKVEQELVGIGVDKEDIVMVNNPPGYYATTERWAIVIPEGGIEATLAAGERYQAKYLLLDKNYPRALQDLYFSPRDRPGLRYLKTIEGIHLFTLGNISMLVKPVSLGSVKSHRD